MPRLRPLILALVSGAALVWTLPAFAVYPGSCTNGRAVYTKTNVATGVTTSCSNSSCHTNNPLNNVKHIYNGAGNPSAINFALDGTGANQEMVALDLRNNLPLSAQDIDDLATYIFYAIPNAPFCPPSSPVLQAAPAPVVFGATTVGSTSASIAVTITNVGTANATGVSLNNTNATEFIVSGSTCTGTVTASGGTCSFSVAFKPSAAGSRSGNIVVNRSGGPGVTVGVSGTGTSGATPGRLSLPASINFGSQNVGTTSSPTSVTVTNTGGAAVTVSNVTSSNAAEFSIVSNGCSTVNAGANCAIGVTFKPTSSGARSANITVTSNGTGSPQTVAASGTGGTGGSSATVSVVEYRNSLFDHYFITTVATEITLLDAHAPPFQDWSRTGFSFNAYVNATAPASSVAICRFFNSTFAPKSSHFYAPHGLGCEATIAGFPDWGLEDDKLFNTMLPDGSGNCPAGTIPVYRLYNNGMGGAPNHRFVTSLAERQNMLNQGFVAEGNGIGVGMCVPP
jgi:hypothetical protein